MKTRLAVAVAAVVFTMFHAEGVVAAEIKILSVPALKTSMDVIGSQFERATGHKVNINYAGSSDLIRLFDAGEPFDMVFVWPAMVDRLLKEGKLAEGTRTEIARVAIGVAVKKGAPKPDISTADAFKRMLLNAESISHSAEGSSGIYLKGLFRRLGIAAEMQPKLRPQPGGPFVVGPVVRGEVEVAVITTPYIVIEPGAELVGLLPNELQEYVVYTTGISATSAQTNASNALIKYLKSPSAASVMKSNGLEPVTP